MSERVCKCGCGESLEGRDARCEFVNDAHKSQYWRDQNLVQVPKDLRAAAANPAPDAPAQLRPAAKRVLSVLRKAGQRGATTGELLQPTIGGARFGARIYELRKAGYTIESHRIRNGLERYFLAGEPAAADQPRSPEHSPDQLDARQEARAHESVPLFDPPPAPRKSPLDAEAA